MSTAQLNLDFHRHLASVLQAHDSVSFDVAAVLMFVVTWTMFLPYTFFFSSVLAMFLKFFDYFMIPDNLCFNQKIFISELILLIY